MNLTKFWLQVRILASFDVQCLIDGISLVALACGASNLCVSFLLQYLVLIDNILYCKGGVDVVHYMKLVLSLYS